VRRIRSSERIMGARQMRGPQRNRREQDVDDEVQGVQPPAWQPSGLPRPVVQVASSPRPRRLYLPVL
jgi:hypothetical protein